jgi:flagellar biosynthetic protein FlhB
LLLGGLAALVFTGGALLDYLAGFLASYLGGQAWMTWIGAGDDQLAASQWNALVSGLARVLLPVLGLMMLLAVAINMLQTGFLFLPHRLVPDFSRVNPLAGWGRLFSPSSAARLGFGIVKVAAIAAMAGLSLYDRREELMTLAGLDLPRIAMFAWDVCLWTSVKIGFALAGLAVLDYGVQRWKLERELRMTPQEVREEMRTLQGDPQVAARRRGLRRQTAIGGIAVAVPKADVIIAAPHGPAVALRYDERSMRAPLVVAKGTGASAEQIRRLAAEHGVAVVEKKQLAGALHRKAAVNQAIPDALFAEVAEALAYAFELKNGATP